MTTAGGRPPRRLRADARDNRDQLLAAARAEFTEQGTHASLNKIAQRAGVGAGTLYRHFPTLAALLAALIGDDVDALCATGRDLMTHPDPDEALAVWLHAVAVHATAMRGLVATQMAALRDRRTAGALAACHDAIRAAGVALLDRAHHHGSAPAHVDIADLLTLVNAAAWASEQAPDDAALLARLLALITAGLRA
ncbi:TetR/AcrR family transcriptional regulator [Frankia gtarii]|uniref:TetR/AcrR family transcriptional regulator n=1 Tax=Frankia gtarii TaxID=2950102 RepID=UPI0021BF3807|nr:TetR/AcrR family transcriptional regulator [Frankia gtarii]